MFRKVFDRNVGTDILDFKLYSILFYFIFNPNCFSDLYMEWADTLFFKSILEHSFVKLMCFTKQICPFIFAYPEEMF